MQQIVLHSDMTRKFCFILFRIISIQSCFTVYVFKYTANLDRSLKAQDTFFFCFKLVGSATQLLEIFGTKTNTKHGNYSALSSSES